MLPSLLFKNTLCLKRWLTQQLDSLDCDCLTYIKKLMTISILNRTFTAPPTDVVFNSLYDSYIYYQNNIYAVSKILTNYQYNIQTVEYRDYCNSIYLFYFKYMTSDCHIFLTLLKKLSYINDIQINENHQSLSFTTQF